MVTNDENNSSEVVGSHNILWFKVRHAFDCFIKERKRMLDSGKPSTRGDGNYHQGVKLDDGFRI